MGIARNLRRLARKQDAVAAKKPQRKAMMEPLEPRLLLSADLNPDAADALADGVQQFGDRVDTFMQDDVFDTNLPFIVQVQQQGETAELVAPTLDTLFAVPVDPDGEGGSGPIAALQALDVGPGDRGGDEKVDAGEFIQGWFFDKINPDDFLNDLNEDGYINTIDFMTYIFNLDNSITINMPGSTPDITVTFNVISASDLTGDVPVADLLFDVDFTLTVSQDMQIDLGTEADALKLEAFTGTYDGASGTYDTKATPLIPIDAALEFGFTFGVRTSGQQSDGQTLNEYDFFIRKADDLNVSAKTHDINIPEDPDDDSTTVDNYGFNLNIGFLGAYVSNGTINYQAQISTLLIDSDSPEVLGFSVDQYGDEETSGIVTGFNAIDSEDLAHDAGFVLRIGNAGIATQVTVTADATNNVLNDLLLDVNSTLGTVGLGGLVTASLVADTDPETGEDITKLQFNLVETTATEFGFASEMYNADGILSAVPTDLEFNSNQSFLLSIGGALPALVEVRFPDPAQTDIGFGTSQAAILPDLVGENTPNFSGNLYEELLIGDLLIPDFSANFTLVVTKSDGFSLTRDVSVTESLSTPDPNVSIANLVSDINQALTNEGLSTLVQAKVSGDKIALYRVSDVVSCIEVTAADAVTQNDIGFEVGQITTLTLTAEDEVSNPSFNDDNDRTDDSANIQLTIKTSSGTVTEIVSVAPGSTTEAALAAAIDTALSDAGFAINATYDSDLDKIVLIAQDASILAFSIKTINDDIGDLVGDVNRALAQAGIDTKVEATTDGTNLFLTSIGSSAGKSLEITHTLTLDAGVTYTELQTPPAFGGTSTEDLFSPSVDEEHSNIFFNLPVHVVNGLNYDPSYVTIAGSFSPFGELLHNNDPDTYPEPVAIYDDTGETSRFKIDFDLDPEIEEQDSPYTIALDTSTLDEKAVLYNMAEPLNFNLITSESMIGLLQNLGAALQDLAESGVFAAYDIPYVDATWADLLNFSDSDKYVFSGLVDRSLIYETNGTGVDVSDDDPETPEDDANRLLMRVVDDNGTSDKDDDTVYLVPTFETAQQLAVRLSYILGVGLIDDGGINANYVPDGTGSGDPEDGVNELTYEIYLTSGGRTIVDLDAVPFEYDVALDDFSKLTLTATVDEEELANQQVALQGFTGLNMTFGIDLSPPGAVIYDDTEIANLNGGEGVDIKTEYALTGDTGVITALSSDAHIYIAIDPDEYTLFSTQVEIEAADTVGNIAAQDYADSINTAMANTVYGSGYLSDYVFAKVIDGKLALEAIGSASTIEVFAGSQTDTAWTELGFSPVGIVGDTVEALKAPTPQVGRLSDDAVFTIDIEGDNNGPYTVTVPENSTVWKKMVKGSFVTYGNNTISDLVSDVNNALAATDIGNALGFLAEQSVEGDTLYAEFNAQLSFSRPVVFSVSVNGGEYVSVEVAPDNYAGINALITAVHEGLVTAGLNEDIMAMASGSKILLTAASGADVTSIAVKGTSKYLSSLITADYDNSSTQGTRLVLSGKNRDTQFSVGASGIAVSELGLPGAANANQTDFVIYDSSGHRYDIVLDNFVDSDGHLTGTVSELIQHINDTITSLNGGTETVVAEYNSTQTGLRLKDINEPHGTDQFNVETINGSGALLTLGFTTAGNEGIKNEYGDGNPYLIEGGPIGLTHLDDRFFVRDAELWGAVGLQTTDEGVSGTGLFGIVGVNTNLQGSLYAEFTAQLKNPATGELGGDVTLLELYNGAKQGRLTHTATFDVTYDPSGTSISDTVTVYASATSNNNSLADLVADVNEAISVTDLSGKIIARVAGSRIEFVSLVKDNPLTEDDESVPFRIVPTGIGTAAELGIELDVGVLWLESQYIDGEQVLAARSASRYAIDEPVVTATDLYELPIYNLEDFNDGFTVGRILYGWDITPDPDVQTADSALVIGIKYDEGAKTGILILSNVHGTFADAEIVFQDYGLNGATKNGELTKRTSFGKFDLTVEVQPGFDDLGFGDGFDQFVGWEETADFNITNFGNPYDPTAPVATFVNVADDLGELYKLRQIDYGDIGSALNQLQTLLDEIESKFTELTDPLPAINKSISELLSLTSGFARGIDNINETFESATLALDPEETDIPALTLQEIPDAIRSAFGLLDVVDPNAKDYNGLVQLDFDTDSSSDTYNMLLLDLQLHQSITTKLGLDIILPDLPNLTSVGVLKVLGMMDINFNVGIDLYDSNPTDDEPNKAYLFDTSNISASLEVVGEGQEYANGEDGVGLVFRASIGPLAVFIQDGEAYMNAQFSLAGLDFGVSGKKLISDVRFEDFTDRDLTLDVDITLPMFYGGEGPNDYVEDFRAYDDGANNIIVEVPDFSFIEDDITSGEIAFDPFDNILLAFDTLNAYLENLSDQIASDILGINLPFVGDQLADFLFIELFRSKRSRG